MGDQVLEIAQSTIPGFDNEKLIGFAQHAAQNPSEVLLSLESNTTWEGYGGTTLAKIGPWQLAGQLINKPTRDFSIQYGAWKEVEEAMGIVGASDRIEPVEAALSAMCACITWAICINASLEGIAFDGLQVKARAIMDPRVLLAALPIEEASSIIQTVEVDVEVQGEVSDADKARIREMTQRSPVRAMIAHPNNIVTRVL